MPGAVPGSWADLPGSGTYALVVVDLGEPAIVVPGADEALVGVEVRQVPAQAGSRGARRRRWR